MDDFACLRMFLRRSEDRLSLEAAAATKSKRSPWMCETQLPYGDGAFHLMNEFGAEIALGTYMLHSEVFMLTAGVRDHWYRRSDYFVNLSVDEWKQLAIPVDENGEYSRCTIRESPDGGAEAPAYGHNIVSTWNLVCHRRWLIDVARIVYTAATVVPLAAATSFADSIGHRAALFITIPVVLISTQFFVLVRAIVTASTSALVPPTIALLADMPTTEKFPAYVVTSSLLSFLRMAVSMFDAHLARTDGVAVQLILMIPTCLLVVLYYTASESPIWILATGNAKEAERVASRAAYMDNVSAEACRKLITRKSDRLCSKLLKTCTVLMCGLWTALCWDYDTLVWKEGVPIGDVASSHSFTLSVIACVATVPFVARSGLRNAVMGLGLGFAITLTALTAKYSGVQILHDSLVVFMRVAGGVCITFFIVMSIP
ncbi:hypothetical protein HPB50_003551 [Hyalomma asiaticum]|uniref:Uncharacterized protein n=1 Tax=Hyalomma asiaticum TaxID=266040 RepID=A0ACB7SUM1_HYAAI|nr:hypothetical protein HPB50_003551 [Hyalomma asiaticum]